MTGVERPSAAARLRAGEPLLGLVVKMANPALVETAGHLGFDLLVLDTEHGPGDASELEHHLRAADAVGLPVLVRVGDATGAEVLRALDAGACGIVAPHVVSADEAHRLVARAHYPPAGTRGLALSTRAGGYGTRPVDEHLQAARSTVVVAQIEDPCGVEQAGAIARTPGIDVLWVGLADLALALGHPGDLRHPAVAGAIERVASAAAATGRAWAVIVDDAEGARQMRARGASVLLVSAGDVVARSLRALRAEIRVEFRDEGAVGPSGDQRPRAAGLARRGG